MLCCREKAKTQNYPLQMTEIPDRPFDKIAIDLITECKTSTSGNKHILTTIDHLSGRPEAYPIPDKTVDTDSLYLYKWIPTSTYVPTIHFIRQQNWIQKQSHGPSSATTVELTEYFQPHIIHRVMASWKFFTNTWSQHLKKLSEKDPCNWEKYLNQVLTSYRVTSNLATAETPFFLVYSRDPNLPLHQLLEPMQHF